MPFASFLCSSEDFQKLQSPWSWRLSIEVAANIGTAVFSGFKNYHVFTAALSLTQSINHSTAQSGVFQVLFKSVCRSEMPVSYVECDD